MVPPSLAGSSRGQLHSQLCELVSQTAIGEVLQSVDEADCEQFYQYYLHDFVRSVHRCHHKQEKSENLEYKVQRSLGKVAERGYPLITIRNFHQCYD